VSCHTRLTHPTAVEGILEVCLRLRFIVLSKNFLSGFGSLDFYDFVFQTSKPEHAVKLKWEFPVSNSERY
jgi:hypothetical protein